MGGPQAVGGGAGQALATFYSGVTPATTYVRCELPARVLPGKVRQHIDFLDNGEDIRFFDHEGAAAVFQFGANKTAAMVSGAMRAQGIRVLVEVDDNYLIHPGKRILQRQQWGMKIGSAENTRDGHRWVVRWADGVIVSTPHLADQYRAVNSSVFVCPNSVDPADWPDPVKPADGVFRVAWVASQSHEDDIPIVARAMEWASRQPGVEAWMVGLNPNATLKFKARWRFPYKQVPWIHTLEGYRACFQRFDLGLAPVSKNPSGLGRSDLKALEYLMGGALPVMQDAAPYQWWRGKPGLIAENADAFLKHVQWAVRNRDEVRALAAEAREIVLAERTNLAQRNDYVEALAG